MYIYLFGEFSTVYDGIANQSVFLCPIVVGASCCYVLLFQIVIVKRYGNVLLSVVEFIVGLVSN